jgi:quercetin dioxygenase-like cupin family protein
LTVLEFMIHPKHGPALHTHLREDEVWYVLEGDFRFKAGDALFQVAKGGMAFGPRGTPHCFQNVGDTPGRLLVVTTTSGAERFFEQYAELLPGPVEPEMLSAVGHANWVEFVGPPVGVSDPL